MADQVPANQVEITKDLMAVLAKHGVISLPQQTTASPSPRIGGGLGNVASYIREIITGDQAFDEGVLSQVANVLAQNKTIQQ